MSVPTQGRRKRVWLLAAMASVCLAGVAAVFWRGPLLGTAAETLLQRKIGIASRIDVSDVDLKTIRLPRLELGEKQEAVFRDVEIDYGLNSFGLDDLQRIEVGDVEIHASYDGTLRLGSLEPLLDKLSQAAAAGMPAKAGTAVHPIVILHRIKLTLDTPIGPQRIEGMATYDKDTLFTNLNWVEDGNAARLNTTATIRTVSTTPRPEGQIQGAITANSALWKLLPDLAPRDGLISIDTALRAGNATTPGSMQLNLSMQGLNFPFAAAPVNGRLGAVLHLADDTTMPRQTMPGAIAFQDLSVDLKGGLSANFVGKLSNGQGRLNIDQGKINLAIDVDANGKDQSLALGGIVLKEPVADIKLHVAYDGATLTVAPREVGKVSVLDLTNAPVRLADIMTVPIKPDGSRLSLAIDNPTAPPVTGKLAFGDTKATLLPAGQKDPLTVTISGAKAAIGMTSTPATTTPPAAAPTTSTAASGTNASATPNPSPAPASDAPRILNGQIVVPGLQIQHRDFTATIGDLQADFSGAPATLTGNANISLGVIDLPPWAVPFRGTAKLTGKPGRLDATATLNDLRGRATFSASGNLDPKKGTGRAHVDLAPLAFAKGGLQIGDLVPQLHGISKDVSGKVALKGDIDLDAKGTLSSDIKLAIENLSGDIGPVVFQNLNGVVTIDHPWPLSTAADQSLAVEQVVIGLPFTNGLIKFDVDDGKQVKITAGQLDLAGGQVALQPTTLSTDAPVQQLTLAVDKLGVGALFQLIGIAGLTGEGELSGTIPVSLFPTGIMIKGGKLASTGPGKLKYDKSAAPDVVKSAGDSVNMALDALSDFRYKELSLTLERQLTGDAALGLHLNGSNPSFYNGYPVEFNFTATGRLDEILRKGLAGYQLPAMIEQRLNEFR